VAPKLSLLPLLLLHPLWAQTDADIPDKNPYTSQTDVERGKRLFGINCAPCHGPEGNGGRGANLARPKLPRAADDKALFFIIRDGIQNTEMPGAWSLSDHEIWQVSAHVRTLGRLAPEKVAGDPRNGRGLFRSKGCVGCHTVGVEGGRVGPALTEIGERRSSAYMRDAILDPPAHLPEDFTMAEIIGTGGRNITGIILSEDTYSVQLRDLSDNLHSLWKRDLTKFEKHTDRTPMPAYRGRLTDTELDDLIAYLASLRGNE
jgi:putative heme-binding domain-containing protein